MKKGIIHTVKTHTTVLAREGLIKEYSTNQAVGRPGIHYSIVE